MAEEVKKKTTSAAKKTSSTTAKKTSTTVKKTTAVKEEAPKAETKKVEKKTTSAHKVSAYIPRVRARYESEVRKALVEKYQYSSSMQIPALEKIVINIGVGDAVSDAKRLEDSVNELAIITGQKPIVTRAKKSVASFKLREGQAIGCKVTLRGTRMYEFFDKLVSIALPRVRDFRGVSKNAFDGRGNYTLGIKEQLIFPEIDYDKVHKVRGMDVVIVTTAQTDEEAFTLLQLLGMPFHR